MSYCLKSPCLVLCFVNNCSHSAVKKDKLTYKFGIRWSLYWSFFITLIACQGIHSVSSNEHMGHLSGWQHTLCFIIAVWCRYGPRRCSWENSNKGMHAGELERLEDTVSGGAGQEKRHPFSLLFWPISCMLNVLPGFGAALVVFVLLFLSQILNPVMSVGVLPLASLGLGLNTSWII